jgi:hypothetical protein
MELYNTFFRNFVSRQRPTRATIKLIEKDEKCISSKKPAALTKRSVSLNLLSEKVISLFPRNHSCSHFDLNQDKLKELISIELVQSKPEKHFVVVHNTLPYERQINLQHLGESTKCKTPKIGNSIESGFNFIPFLGIN